MNPDKFCFIIIASLNKNCEPPKYLRIEIKIALKKKSF